MKFLCLAGAGANPETFRKQLLPIIQDLERDGEHSFHCMAGSLEMTRFADVERYFVAPPYLRFLESAWPGASDEHIYAANARAPDGITPEDRVRYLRARLPPKDARLLPDVLGDIHRRFDEEGPFDCILGHSEGGCIAATFVVDSLKKSAEGKGNVPPKCAVFVNGSVPHTADGKGWLLADECGQLITIPTCHFTAHNDALVSQAVALYHLCDEDGASMVDLGRGHAIPRDAKSCKQMTQAIRDLVDRTRREGGDGEDLCAEGRR